MNRRIRGSRLSNSCLIDIYDSDKEVLTMAVPKRKHSKARRDKRRSNVWKMDAPALVKCPQCGEYKRAHRLCGNCGYYNGRQIIKKEA